MHLVSTYTPRTVVSTKAKGEERVKKEEKVERKKQQNKTKIQLMGVENNDKSIQCRQYILMRMNTHTRTYDVTYLYTHTCIYLRDKHVCQTQPNTFSKICVALQRLFAISFLSSIQFI